jgi:hypothetical protein
MLALIVAATVASNTLASLPAAVTADIEYSREMCRSLGFPFMIDEEYIEKIDFNEDGADDYILDTRGFDCGKKTTEALFHSTSGTPFYLYLSDGKGDWKKTYNAFVYEYQVKKEYGQIPYLDVWVRGEVGYQVVYQRFQWNGKEMAVIDQEIGAEVPTQLWKKFD